MHFATIETPEERFKQIVLNGGQTRIFASGPIDEGATAKFCRFIEDNSITWAKVYLDSPGGSLWEGLKLGHAIREFGFDTQVGNADDAYPELSSAICASAAAYTFAGGLSRFYSEHGGRLGVHQFSRTGDNLEDLGVAQQASARLISYLQEMGVNATAFVRSTQATAAEMVWLTPEEALSFLLSNNGTHPTTANIRIAEVDGYLRLEQVHHDVTARVILGYKKGQFLLSGGIVTTPERSEELISYSSRAYFEFDGSHPLGIHGVDTAEAMDHVVWISGVMDEQTAKAFASTDNLGMWLDNEGPGRWGAMIDLKSVRNDIEYYISNCR